MSTALTILIAIVGVLVVPFAVAAGILVAALPLAIVAMFDVEDDNGEQEEA